MVLFLTEQSPEELHREREELKKTLIRKVSWQIWLVLLVSNISNNSVALQNGQFCFCCNC